MGLSNFLGSSEEKIAKLKGDLERARSDVKHIEEGVGRLSDLYIEIRTLEQRIAAGIAFVKPDYPDWQPEKIKPRETRSWKSPFPVGEAGRVALDVLRQADDWMTVREIARAMLANIEHDPGDRKTLDKVANSLGNNLRHKVGDLVESEGTQPVRYRVIRQFEKRDSN